MGVSTGPYEESVVLSPWDYGGPEHANRVPHVAIVDARCYYDHDTPEGLTPRRRVEAEVTHLTV